MNLIKYILLIVILLFSFCLLSQESKFSLPFNEITISVNKSPSRGSGNIGYYGFGVGMNKSFRDSNLLGVIVGLNYNQTSQFNESLSVDRFTSHSDIRNVFHAISVPITLRIKLRKSQPFFFELGAYLDYLLLTHESYTVSGCVPSNDTVLRCSSIPMKGNYWGGKAYLGFNLGVGAKFKVFNQQFFMKLDTKVSFKNLNDRYYSSQNPSIYNGYNRFTLGYRIPYN